MITVIGADPGETTGLAVLHLTAAAGSTRLCIAHRSVISCDADSAYGLAMHLIEENEGPSSVILAGEKFVPGRGPGARGDGAAAARRVTGDLSDLGPWRWRSASEVKGWATDQRLAAAGLLKMSAKMPDGRDGARHALFAACHDAGLDDPLSRRA